MVVAMVKLQLLMTSAMLNSFSLVIGKVVKDYGTHGDPWVSLFSKLS